MTDDRLSALTSLGITDHSEPTGASSEPPRVLVVDDDPGMLLLMEETLANAGFEVTAAGTGAEAIDACGAAEPDLVLLDINMPVMDGITACAEIRARNARHFPIIMVTSVDDAVSIQRAFDAGANDFILKPVNWPLFQRRLDSVLADWDRSQELDESNRRVLLLEKVVPEYVMLVSRNGTIVEDLKRHHDSVRAEPDRPMQTLEDIFGADIAVRFRQRISGVLKTSRQNNLRFSLTEHRMLKEYDAQFMVDGRDRVIIVVQNVSAEKATQNEIYDLAFYDADSTLPNRHLFQRAAEEALIDAGLHSRSVVFLSLSFDNLSVQYRADPEVMSAVAERLRKCLAESNLILSVGSGEHASRVSRIDSNQFVIMLDVLQQGDDAGQVAERIADGFVEPVVAGTLTISLSPRLGVAGYAVDGHDVRSLLRAAGSAMREARETGEVVCFNAQSEPRQDMDTLDYGSELRQAMDQGQLELYFQPRFSASDGRVTCVEALLRWNHPIRGFVGLPELLQLAKATGLILPLGTWVLRTACAEAQSWQCDPAPRVSVNLSRQELGRDDLADRLIEIFGQTGLDPQRMDLELTEAALLRSENGLTELNRLKKLGVGLVLDDFGTGYSSLAFLKEYPIDALKIDGSFVRDLPDSAQDGAVCEVIITLAHKLGMKAVAEGVETGEQMAFLQSRGCDEIQGFHVCRPLPASEIEKYLLQSGKKA